MERELWLQQRCYLLSVESHSAVLYCHGLRAPLSRPSQIPIFTILEGLEGFGLHFKRLVTPSDRL
jgi:hypothetical protein